MNWRKALGTAAIRYGHASSIFGDIVTGEGEEAHMTPGDMRQLMLGGRPWTATKIEREAARVRFASRFDLPFSKKPGEWSPEFEKPFGMYMAGPEHYAGEQRGPSNPAFGQMPQADLPSELSQAIKALQASVDRNTDATRQMGGGPTLGKPGNN